MEELTDRQLEYLRYIAKHRLQTGMSPTVREMGAALGVGSTNGVNDVLDALERKGCITASRMKARSTMLTDRGRLLVGEKQTLAEAARLALQVLEVVSDERSLRQKVWTQVIAAKVALRDAGVSL